MVDSRRIVSCPTHLGVGGLGQHLAKVCSDARAEGRTLEVACLGGEGTDIHIPGGWERQVFRWPPFRWRPELRVWFRHEVFDRLVASRMGRVDEVVAFLGGAEKTFLAARRRGASKLVLEMPNSHPSNVRALHARALRLHPMDRSWMGAAFERKAIREMALADEIRINSEYSRRTCIERGVDPAKLVRRELGFDPRFLQVRRRPHPEGLRVALYVGSFSVFKGVPLLVEAFSRVPGEDLRLVLMGGWTDHAMKVWLERARGRDPRVSWTSGDPAPHLATASVAVHPSWDDSWGYGPAEAAAAGVPLLVSDRTGMIEMAAERPMEILPVGDLDAWTAALRRWAEGTV